MNMRVVLVAQSCLTLCDPWTVAHQAPLSMEFSRQEYWSGEPFPSPGHLPDPGITLGSRALQVDSLPFVGRPLQTQRSPNTSCLNSTQRADLPLIFSGVD